MENIYYKIPKMECSKSKQTFQSVNDSLQFEIINLVFELSATCYVTALKYLLTPMNADSMPNMLTDLIPYNLRMILIFSF